MNKKYEYNDMSSLFEPIIDELNKQDIGVFGPTSLQDYLTVHNFPKVVAPPAISIDSLERLHSSLRNNSAMVFRLGKSSGIGTQFAVVRVNGKVNDFFIIDQDIFSSKGIEYLPKVSDNQLFAYKLLPRLTETSLVNLGFSSGLISYALGLDEEKPIFPPATCNSTYTFDFRPHTSIDACFTHKNGQVEIDSLFVERRKGIQTLFVIEAKYGGANKSLAKHKLVYPVLGIAPQVPKDIPIVPVYIKVLKSIRGLHFHIVECTLPDPREVICSYNALNIANYTHLILPSNIFENT